MLGPPGGSLLRRGPRSEEEAGRLLSGLLPSPASGHPPSQQPCLLSGSSLSSADPCHSRLMPTASGGLVNTGY